MRESYFVFEKEASPLSQHAIYQESCKSVLFHEQFAYNRLVTNDARGTGRAAAEDRVMLAGQRQAAIHERVRRLGGVHVSDLVREFGVSDMTIRRDLDSLAERGLVVKVHGGATAVGLAATDEPGFAAKASLQQPEKQAIAAQAASLVAPRSAIALSGGTTVWTMAPLLVGVAGLTVVTNSVPVADVFYRAARPDQTVILTGGVRTASDALVGPLAVAAIRSLNLDRVFLGVHGMSLDSGFTTPNVMEAEVDQTLVAAARELIVLADHTKWNTVGLCTIAPLARASMLISDTGLPGDARAALSEEVGQLVTVEPVGLEVSRRQRTGARRSGQW
jgi:DeoR/GlpR family transcriptional regulator of sugar metabolism